jgi:DNA-binding transcriptional regulator YbjK
MPKIVDHDERRRVIVEALWRVVARDGAHEVSVRHVAAEAGMPKSSIGHYVGTMPQLMGLAVDQLIEANTDYLMTLDLLELDVDKVTATLCTLVPVTDQQRLRSGVWLLLIAQAGADPEFAEVLHRLNTNVTDGLRELLAGMARQGLLHPSRDIDTEVRRLHAIIDGLAVQSMTDRAVTSEADVRTVIRGEVLALAQPCGVRVR